MSICQVLLCVPGELQGVLFLLDCCMDVVFEKLDRLIYLSAIEISLQFSYTFSSEASSHAIHIMV